MREKKFSLTDAVNIILPLVIIIEYVSSVYPSISLWLDILAVLLIIAIYFLILIVRNIQMTDIFFMLFTLFMVIMRKDVSFVSILSVYVLFSLRKYYNKKTIKNCLAATAISISVIVLCYLFFGLNKQHDTQIYRPLLGRTVSRMCFGFTHPNQFTIHLLALTVFVYLATNKFLAHTFITALDVVFFYLTQSRTVLCVVLFVYIAVLCIKIFKLRNIRHRTTLPAIYIFFVIIAVMLSVYCAGTKIDTLLTGRLALNKQYLGSVSLFGTDAFDNTYFDNSYVHMMVSKGIIYTAVYSVLFITVLYKTKFSWVDAVILTAIFLEAFMEVIFLKYSFMILLPLICRNRIILKHDTEKNSLLLVRGESKIQTG